MMLVTYAGAGCERAAGVPDTTVLHIPNAGRVAVLPRATPRILDGDERIEYPVRHEGDETAPFPIALEVRRLARQGSAELSLAEARAMLDSGCKGIGQRLRISTDPLASHCCHGSTSES
jgi:hypothetical protein